MKENGVLFANLGAYKSKLEDVNSIASRLLRDEKIYYKFWNNEWVRNSENQEFL